MWSDWRSCPWTASTPTSSGTCWWTRAVGWPGHLAFWRERDRVLILGDVLFHRNPMTLKKGLAEPFAFATFDAPMNRASARRLAALQPAVVCFGHGAPLRDSRRFAEFVSDLRPSPPPT